MNRSNTNCHKFITKLESAEVEAAVSAVIINTFRLPYVSLTNPHKFDVKIIPVLEEEILRSFKIKCVRF